MAETNNDSTSHERELPKYILALDIGGTHTRLALIESKGYVIAKFRSIYSSIITDITDPINDFLKDCHKDNQAWTTDTAAIACAGIVENNKCPNMVNVPFSIDDQKIIQKTCLKTILVMNDFVAEAYGALHFKDSKDVITPLTENSSDEQKPMAVIGAGTGLGMSLIINNKAVPSEGGHTLLGAQTTELQHIQ